MSRNAGSKESNLPSHISWTRTHCGSTRFSIFERLRIRCDLRGRRNQKTEQVAVAICKVEACIMYQTHQDLSLTNQALRGPFVPKKNRPFCLPHISKLQALHLCEVVGCVRILCFPSRRHIKKNKFFLSLQKFCIFKRKNNLHVASFLFHS